ncbi:hypothetical protein HY637_01055 [Candidatus Woesearchaeota archaeon]|nr:hypothetical protein [Candidatus Woesearchaeota archaeon]
MSNIQIFFKGVKRGFGDFSHLINNIINFFLLLIVYIVGIGPVSAISKLFGKHFLDIKRQNKASNWHEHKVTKQPIEKYYRTF